MILRIHHALITIPPEAEAQARQFYCEVLGLPEIPRPASLQGLGGFWVQVGDRELHVGTESGVERHATKAHLAYQVDELACWRSRLSAAGIVIQESIPIPGYARFECRDPFGNLLEFTQALPATGG